MHNATNTENAMNGSVLNRDSILGLIDSPEPLVEEYLDLKVQVQPNGMDLTLREVREFTSVGEVGLGASPPELSQSRLLPFDAGGYLYLALGSYVITLNEIVCLPLHIMALARPRSSLIRCGVAIHTAVWDAGYRGRSQALLTVYNPGGYRLARGARVLQMVFLRLASGLREGYRGRYMEENI